MTSYAYLLQLLKSFSVCLSHVTEHVQHVMLPAIDLNITQRSEKQEMSGRANTVQKKHSCSRVTQLPHVLCCAEVTAWITYTEQGCWSTWTNHKLH